MLKATETERRNKMSEETKVSAFGSGTDENEHDESEYITLQFDEGEDIECEILGVKASKIEDRLNYCLETLGTLKDDEARAREQLKEIKLLLRESKYKINEYKLPVIIFLIAKFFE